MAGDTMLILFIGQEAADAAWYYPEPKTDRASKLKDHVAFCEHLDSEGMGLVADDNVR